MRRATSVVCAGLAFLAVALLVACSGDAGPSAPTVAENPSASPSPTVARTDDPTWSGTDRVARVSAWAQGEALLTGEDVVTALGESTTTVVDAESTDIARDRDAWAVDVADPFPPEEAVMEAGVRYVLERTGRDRTVTTYVSEYVAHLPRLRAAYAAVEAGEGRRNTPDERYAPAAVGVEAFAYETDGGSGALDRLVVVRTRDALVVVVASPASPDAPEADLTGAENLTRAQVDAIVRAAVDTLG